MAYSIITKDPTENVSVDIDWTDWLEGDTITSSSWSLPPDLVSDIETNTTTKTSIWLVGGNLREHYFLVNEIVTNSGRITKRTVVVRMVDK